MWTLLTILFAQTSPLQTPYAQKQALGLDGTRVVGSAKAGLPVEVAVDARGTFGNPFDPEDIRLDATVTPPKGDSYTIPGFFMVAHRREGDDVVPVGEQGWRVRFYPPAAGTYQISLTLTDRAGAKAEGSASVSVEGNRSRGMVRLSPKDRRYFETEDGKSFYPLGSNTGWAGPKALGDFATWLPKYGAQGANWGRIWLSPGWTTFALEQTGKREEGKGMGQFDQKSAARIDEVLQIARASGMYLQLCIDSYNILRHGDAHPFWSETPHNRENGGPLRLWSDFWTDPTMSKLYRAKLRYLVARYAANPHVFAWEFWNEVDLTGNFDVEKVRAWHAKMGRELKALDPYPHPITTSFAGSNGFREIDMLPEMDFVQTHHYGQDPGGQVLLQQIRKATWGKAHFAGEIGADAGGPRAAEDKRGIQIHDPIWASIASGASGGAMPWWWDSYIEPLNLYPIYGAASRFIEGIDWPSEGFRIARPSLAYATPPKTPRMKDAVLSGGPVSWDPGKANRPAKVSFANGKFSGALPLAGIQHGMTNHPDLHNPVQFTFTLPQMARFEVEVGNVSGHGGAKLEIYLDGQRVMTRDFADPDGTEKTEDLVKYAGTYGINVPAGRHTVIVQNTGRDWFYVSYRLLKAVPVNEPPLSATAVTGNNTAIVWLRTEGANWRDELVLKRTPAVAPSTVIRLPGLGAGRWRVEHWDTWRGVRTRNEGVTVGVNGVLQATLPAITRDMALKIVRAQP